MSGSQKTGARNSPDYAQLTPKELEAEADNILARACGRASKPLTAAEKAAKKIARLEREPAFDEAAGRALFDELPSRASVSPAFDDNGEFVSSHDGRTDWNEAAGTVAPSPVDKATHDALAYVLFAGQITGRAILARAVAAGLRAGMLSRDEAIKLTGCSARTARRMLNP